MSFKTCPCCEKIWEYQSEFIADNNLKLNGYSADFENLLNGLFFFTHHQEGCYSTMAIKAADFQELYSGAVYTQRMTGLAECSGLCQDKERLEQCDVPCECAFIREIIAIIRKKQSS